MEIISRKEALERGLLHYFTGKPCKYGHTVKRYVKDKKCVDCNKEKKRLYRNTPDGKAYMREYNKSDKAKTIKKEYNKSSQAKAWWKEYRQSPKGKAYRRSYSNSPALKSALYL